MNIGQALVAISLVLNVGFGIRLGNPNRSSNPPAAWLQFWLVWLFAAFDSWLLAMSYGIHLDLLVFLILIGQDVVFAWRWWRMERLRRVAGYNERQERLRRTDD